MTDMKQDSEPKSATTRVELPKQVVPAAAAGPKPKPRENKLLIFIAVAFVGLYVVLTAYVILSNKTIGGTQLEYSALHKEQLQLVQDEMARLTKAIVTVRREQDGALTLHGTRFDGLESRLNQLGKALEVAESSRQTLAKASADSFRQQIAVINGAVGALKTEQGQVGNALGGRLTELQNKLTALTTTLDALQSQQTEATAALAAQLVQLQKQTLQIASSKASLDQIQFLSGLIDTALARGTHWQQLTEENLPEAVKWWRQSQLLVGAANTETALAEKMRQLSAESARVRQLIVKAIPPAMRRYHETALKATAKDQAMTAWSEAGEILALFPVTAETTSDAINRELLAEHESVRQQLQARNQ